MKQAPKTVEQVTEAVTRAKPDAQAIILFGSRAKGTHRPDSDWDIALEDGNPNNGKGAQADAWLNALSCLQPPINVATFQTSQFNERIHPAGSLAREIAIHGIRLKGEWQRPQLSRAPTMDAEAPKARPKLRGATSRRSRA